MLQFKLLGIYSNSNQQNKYNKLIDDIIIPKTDSSHLIFLSGAYQKQVNPFKLKAKEYLLCIILKSKN